MLPRVPTIIFFKWTNRILKKLLILLQFTSIVVACFVTDWSKLVSMNHSDCVFAL